MKLRQLLSSNIETELTASQTNIQTLETRILTEIELLYPETQKRPVFAWSKFGFIGLCLLLAIAGVGLYTRQANIAIETPFQFVSPAHAAVAEIAKALDKPLSYTIEHHTFCNTRNWDQLLKDESGNYEANPMVLSEKADCDKNNGVLTSRSSFMYDPHQKAAREESIDVTRSNVQLPDKNGTLHDSIISPVKIYKDNTTYVFMAAAVKNSQGKFEGVYVKPSDNDPAYSEARMAQRLTPTLPTIQNILETYTNASTDAIAVEEVIENGTTYTVLKYTDTSAQSNREDWFVKDSKQPYKSVEYMSDGTPWFENIYSDFSETIPATAFDVTVAPEGYEFISGSLKRYDTRVVICNSCTYDDPLYYEIMPATYLNSDGKEVSFPVQQLDRLVQQPFSLSVEEKNESGTFDKLTDASAEKIQLMPLGFIYKSLATIGSKTSATLRVTSTNSKTGEVVTSTQSVNIPYTADKLPDSGDLRFKAAENFGRITTLKYQSTRYPNILIAVQPTFDQDLCKGYREPTTCEQGTDGEFTISKVTTQQNHETNLSWWRTDIVYKDLFVTIQFNNVGNMSDEAKTETVEEAKTLLKFLDTEWER